MPLADPGLLNLTVYAGATFSLRMSPSGTPWDLTGYDARMTVRSDYTSATPVLTLGTAAGSATLSLGGTAGWVQIDIDATTTAAIGSAAGYAAASYVYDLELVDGTDVTRFAQGIFAVSPESTR